MKTYELSIDREIQFMIKYQLTPDEFFLMRLIFYAQEGQDKYISQFANECGFEKPIREILNSLQDKGIINKSYVIPQAGEIFNPQDVDFNKNVLNQFFQHTLAYIFLIFYFFLLLLNFDNPNLIKIFVFYICILNILYLLNALLCNSLQEHLFQNLMQYYF